MTEKEVLHTLSFVIEPDLKKDLVELDLVTVKEVKEKHVSIRVQVSNPAMHSKKRMEEACIHQIHTKLGEDIAVEVEVVPLDKKDANNVDHRKVLPGVKHIVAIASGKGGVGKSTVTANLAAGLAAQGYKVGLIDADIYGPSAPLMFDVQDEKPGVIEVGGKQLLTPVESHGVKILSIGFFADINQAIVWRGPMASKALDQMINDVSWGELDFMLIDLPPGTGDVHLSIVQAVPLSGAIIVSTPQPIALADARKGIGMFKLDSINVPVLGLIENMAWFTPAELPDNKYYIFGKDGAKELAESMNVKLLGQIPLVQSIRESGDVGRPAVLQENTPQAQTLRELTQNFSETLLNAS